MEKAQDICCVKKQRSTSVFILQGQDVIFLIFTFVLFVVFISLFNKTSVNIYARNILLCLEVL